MKRSNFDSGMDRLKVERYLAAGKHLNADGSTRTFTDMAHVLKMSRKTLLRLVHACPEWVALLAATRTHARGGARSTAAPTVTSGDQFRP